MRVVTRRRKSLPGAQARAGWQDLCLEKNNPGQRLLSGHSILLEPVDGVRIIRATTVMGRNLLEASVGATTVGNAARSPAYQCPGP